MFDYLQVTVDVTVSKAMRLEAFAYPPDCAWHANAKASSVVQTPKVSLSIEN